MGLLHLNSLLNHGEGLAGLLATVRHHRWRYATRCQCTSQSSGGQLKCPFWVRKGAFEGRHGPCKSAVVHLGAPTTRASKSRAGVRIFVTRQLHSARRPEAHLVVQHHAHTVTADAKEPHTVGGLGVRHEGLGPEARLGGADAEENEVGVRGLHLSAPPRAEA